MSSNDNIRIFCEQHRIRLLDKNKRAHKYHKVDVRYFGDPMDYNRVSPVVLEYETEPLYTLEVAESELEKIADFEQQVFNNAKQTGHYNLFQTVMEQKEQEKYLRNRYPAVKKAYEQYSLMLKLAQSGEL